MTLRTRPLLVLYLLLLFSVAGRADTLSLTEAKLDGLPIELLPYFDAWEDPTHQSDTTNLLQRSLHFQPLSKLEPQSRTSYYWLSVDLKNATAARQALALAFTSLTYVDVYLYRNGELELHRSTGHFRSRKFLTKGDSRLHVMMNLDPLQRYRLILKVYHSKRYMPVFNFYLQPKDAYVQQTHRKEIIDTFSLGAVMLFFVYSLLSWLVSRFRPYIWLMCFISGIALYGICSAGYMIEWFFPYDPESGWLFNTPSAHLGSFGIYMLLVDFWQLKKYNPILYRLGVMLIIEVTLLTIFGFTVNAISGNFNLVNTVNLWTFPLPFAFMCASLWCCWKRLTRPQKYLGYGLLLFFIAAAFTVVSSAILHEKSILMAPYISNFTTLAVFLLFATGLKEELRQHEIDKYAALEELNQLQRKSKKLLEKEVEDRTSELKISHDRLKVQADLLADRNTKIETLINELNHRVKNNLQLLYSLISLQVPSISDHSSREILKGNLGKIKAMMLVNQKLFRFDEGSSVNVDEFTNELTTHLQKIYDSKGKISIIQDVEKDIMLHGKLTLSFGLILSELLTNSFKYAFADHECPAITITVMRSPDGVLFRYSDNGRGMDLSQAKGRRTMGLSLIHDLARQMNGKLQVSSENGLSYEFQIPV
ncbi:MAG: histidine kinase dimerization/phosphoacceptor domain -containing protein [Pseudobacter sp.]|uniref:histidine kinase dimerization/phosphoacceptor domain -containing protein n=1 Tax=Pseudobacter sp. TaxID=2045420 RepID=UPI003F80A429